MEPDTKSCDDGLLCTVDDRCTGGTCGGTPRPCAACEGCDPAAGCVAMPRPSCRQSLAPRHSTLAMRRRAGRPDRLSWRWSHGAATFTPDLGDPTTTDAYAFCLYDVSATSPSLLGRATAPAGGICGGRSCWRNPRPGRFLYRDRTGATDGLTGIALSWGNDGRARMAVHRSGPALVPDLPIAGPLLVQLHSATGRCWETRHGPLGTGRNDSAAFRAIGE